MTSALPPETTLPAEDAAPSSSTDLGPDRPSSSAPPPIDDPFLVAPPAPPPSSPQAGVSKLAVSSVLAALLLGPVGAVCAIVFGLAARRELDASGVRRGGYALATVGVALGVVLTMVWGAGFGLYVLSRRLTDGPTVASATEPEPRRDTSPGGATVPQPTVNTPRVDVSPTGTAPKQTRTQRMGSITVVDLGSATSSLSEELAKQRAEAATKAETIVVMTTGDPCEPCRGVDRSLRDPLMQTALAKVRLVRVDIGVFRDDLEQQKMQHDGIPTFFLLAVDLTPKDIIDGGEWDDDIAPNIAPVLGAFVRGKYTTRRQVWQPPPGSGVRL